MLSGTAELAINPLPWVFTAKGFDLSPLTLSRAMDELAPIGYKALHSDIPVGMTPHQYRQFLAEHGFHPAPGYFSGAFSDATRREEVVEAARRHAAAQAELGLTEVFLAASLTDARKDYPGQGCLSSNDELNTIADGLVQAAEAATQEGVTFALHPHIGSPVETDAEIRTILDRTAGSHLAFGPDTGHLYWGGAQPEVIIRDYADRVAAVHVKDVNLGGLEAARASGASYFPATLTHHVWTEPGRGAINFDAVFAALPANFRGWIVVEVDVPHAETARESARISYDFLTPRYLHDEHS